jgi:hypothetical protein
MRPLHVLSAALSLVLLAPPLPAQGWLDSGRIYTQPDQGEFQYLADLDLDGQDDLVWFTGVPGTPTQWQSFRVLFCDGHGDGRLRVRQHLVLVCDGALR